MPRRRSPWPRAALLALAPLAGACSDEVRSSADGIAAVDLLSMLVVEEGATGSVRRREPVQRSAWEHVAPEGAYHDLVTGEGGRQHDALFMMIGGGASIRVPVPASFECRSAELWLMTPSAVAKTVEQRGFDLAITWIGDSVVQVPARRLPAMPKPTALRIEVPKGAAPRQLVLEFSGDATLAGLAGIDFHGTTEGGDAPRPLLLGARADERSAVALVPGTRVAASEPIAERRRGRAGEGAARDVTFAVASSSPDGRFDVVARLEHEGREVAAHRVQGEGQAWTQGRLRVPEGAGALRFVLEVSEHSSPCLVSELAVRDVAPEPRTVLLITSDTHRGDHMGRFSGGATVHTPALNALADRGIYFTNAFAPTNVTTPSHVTLMTGLHVRDTHIADNSTALSESAATLAEEFSAAGYRTFAATSVAHLARRRSGLGQGFDRYDAPSDGKRDGRVAIARMLEWLAEAEGHAVFAWLHLYDAHAPYDASDELIERQFPGGAAAQDPAATLGLPDAFVPPWIRARGYNDPRYVTARYRAAIDYVDVGLADLLGHARMDRALIAFTADHGESLGDDGIHWEHSHLNVATLHVPLVLAWPGCEPREVGAPVRMMNLGRTLLELAELPAARRFPGRNLVASTAEEVGIEPRYGLAAHGRSASIELGGWLLTLQISEYPAKMLPRNWERGEVELFDLRRDPHGLENRLEEELERATRLRETLIRWLESADPDGLAQTVEISDSERANLEALGYSAGESRATGQWWTVPDDAPWAQRFEASR